MGCDIHLFVEVRKNGKWKIAGKPVYNEYYNYGLVPWWLRDNCPLPPPGTKVPLTSQYTEDGEDKNKFQLERFYRSRNYALFGILAGVRWEDVGCIAEPRGVPEDASPEFKKEAKDQGEDGHSHSFLTIQELISFDWTKEIVLKGAQSLCEYLRQHKSGSWYDDYAHIHTTRDIRSDIVLISEEEANKTLVKLEKQAKKQDPENYRQLFEKLVCRWSNTYEFNCWEREVRHNGPPDEATKKEHEEWIKTLDDPKMTKRWVKTQIAIPLYKYTKEFWQDAMPRLLALGKPEDVRIVFFFDN